jgi:hypothetical protein
MPNSQQQNKMEQKTRKILFLKNLIQNLKMQKSKIELVIRIKIDTMVCRAKIYLL